MIDTDDLDNMSRRDLVELLEVYNESLAEVKRLQKALRIEQQIVQAFYEYRDAISLGSYSMFTHCEAWMLEKGHRIMVNGQSEWAAEIQEEEE